MSRLLVILAVLVVILLAGFALASILIPTPGITRILPADAAIDIPPDTPITLTFSTAMDQLQTQSNIRIEPRVSGIFAWVDDRTLTWTPRSRLPLSTTITVRVAADALSSLRRPLGAEFVSRFTTLGPTMLIASNPNPDARFVYQPGSLTMTFSRPLDGGLLADSISIAPPLSNQRRSVSGDTLTVQGFFEPHTRYQITIPSVVTDSEYGIGLDRNYLWSFTTTAQYPHFSILNRDRTFKFASGAPVSIPTQFTNVSRLDVKLYPLTAHEFETQSGAPYETWIDFRPASSPRLTTSIETDAQLDKYTQQSVDLGSLSPGAYYLDITAPEGVRDTQLLLIE